MGGGDKGLLELAPGVRLVDLVVARLGPQVEMLVLNANGDPARFADLGMPVLPDDVPDLPGPLAGVLAGMDWAAARGLSHVVTAAADTPFLPRDLVARLAAAGGFALAATPGPDGPDRHPTFGLWPVVLRSDLRRALESGVRKIVAWTDAHGAATAIFETVPRDPFFNVNTPDDLAVARRMLETDA